ncbi:MAG TPA: hypothetical protein VGS62_05740 [Streptosporangiaceae bacterium]|nr:hypothetical protein [Streptosporangiaceae bacterium]
MKTAVCALGNVLVWCRLAGGSGTAIQDGDEDGPGVAGLDDSGVAGVLATGWRVLAAAPGEPAEPPHPAASTLTAAISARASRLRSPAEKSVLIYRLPPGAFSRHWATARRRCGKPPGQAVRAGPGQRTGR